MAHQKVYRGKPTAKSVLFALWDDGDDDHNAALVRELDISIATLKSYRVEWRKERGLGVKRSRVIAKIDPASLPLATKKGVVWHVWVDDPNERLKCERCPIRARCIQMVSARAGVICGYLGCESVYECELW